MMLHTPTPILKSHDADPAAVMPLAVSPDLLRPLLLLCRELVAVKVVSSHSAKQQARFTREIATLRACHNPHIVQFLGACMHMNQTLLVMQYMPGGDLYSKLADDTTGMYNWYQR